MSNSSLLAARQYVFGFVRDVKSELKIHLARCFDIRFTAPMLPLTGARCPVGKGWRCLPGT
jgi:hypothetical protein